MAIQIWKNELLFSNLAYVWRAHYECSYSQSPIIFIMEHLSISDIHHKLLVYLDWTASKISRWANFKPHHISNQTNFTDPFFISLLTDIIDHHSIMKQKVGGIIRWKFRLYRQWWCKMQKPHFVTKLSNSHTYTHT